ncbi:hypothetical protein KUV62_15855 [Salipiger bermudensis]|uniref:hypothetical protein n=1 Tax=Salipiger bermudensis TaxID=344736 RepID=UPI001C99C96F|nr:hypothetical protein [Salipiger bermudensis]MBY6005400.1 hypothetical protein [Salipiger bermudensis]
MGKTSNITAETLAPIWANRGIPTQKVADMLGIERSTLCWKRSTLGIPPRVTGRVPKADEDTFRRMWLAGVNVREMAEFFGYRCKQAVKKRRTRLGLPPRPVGSKGKSITLAQFHEQEIARRMSAQAGGKKIRAAGGEDRSQMWS